MADYAVKTKDHLIVKTGEVVHVLLINHAKLPDGKYLVEKDDGSSERKEGWRAGERKKEMATCVYMYM